MLQRSSSNFSSPTPDPNFSAYSSRTQPSVSNSNKQGLEKQNWTLLFFNLIFWIFSTIHYGKNRADKDPKVAVIVSALDKFAKVIMEKRMNDLYKELNSKEAKRQRAVLSLLASIVRRSSWMAWEVAKSFDFKIPIFGRLAKSGKQKKIEGRKEAPFGRKAFVGLLYHFGGFSSQFIGPTGLRSVLFGSVTLEQLASISGQEDLARYPSPLRGNPKRLLGLMKKLKAGEIENHRNLLLAIVKGKPSFGSAYLDEFPYSLEDPSSRNWFASVSLAAHVLSSVGDGLAFGFLDSQTQGAASS
ncbi:hypothetical protein HAX54_019312 [Datura stramonium]|uniref:URB1 N-terminal domain-containing protein n=1 Tax=Datura stramonium TaxID=4076 RepID=A0ABS8UQ23_DATST|nr:hypothetical protein [Datura stramonium]